LKTYREPGVAGLQYLRQEISVIQGRGHRDTVGLALPEVSSLNLSFGLKKPDGNTSSFEIKPGDKMKSSK
jgi:hypothetical protein